MRFAEVAVDAPTEPDRTFSYSVPDSLGVRQGQLVRVPFGPRALQGVVFSLEPSPQVPQTRDIESVIIAEPTLDATRLDLARWLSRYYMCSLFEAATLMLPPGEHVRSKTYITLTASESDLSEVSLTRFQERILNYFRDRESIDQDSLISTFGERVRSSISSLVKKGVVVRTNELKDPSIGPKYQEFARFAANRRQEADTWLSENASRSHRQAALLMRLLEDDTLLELSHARKEYGSSPVNALLARGWLLKEQVVIERNPLEGKSFPPAMPVTLTSRQAAIASEIQSVMDNQSITPRTFLIQGVTGSGKTEIYLNAVEHCLNLGKRAIVLVPEIALTYQTIERFASRFPGQVAVLHSGLPSGERYDQWWKICHGEYGAVIGSRSAIFAPQPDLGLIVMDEEHEWTYKHHDASPRYHARDVALKLAEFTEAVVVLGSASPDVGSYYKGLKKDYRLHLLPDRVLSPRNGAAPKYGSASLASVRVVDMREELREGNRGIFSRALDSAIDDCRRSGGQMMLFLNRRGSSAYLMCRNCGYNLRCRRCDISMTYHKQAERFLCHYCGYRRTAPDKCPQCLSYRMSYYGIGTQSVVEEVQHRYPDLKVLRWDSDVTSGPRAYEDMLTQFRSGQAQVLAGTQMIAKGLHFPSVTLVGVVSADVGLNIPDYRAGERAFQLLCQVAGRAGRGASEGKVIVQTYQPENYAIQTAASQDYQTFYTKEMAFRRQQSNPPYSKLIHLLHTHTNMAECERKALELADRIRQEQQAWGLSDVEVLGPNPAYPARLRGRYRWHIILRGPEPRTLLDKVSIPQGWTVDIDPVTLT